jgi:hypothetical protein
MEILGKKTFCPKEDRDGDFIVDDNLFEVGGRSKKHKKSNFVIRDDIDTATKSVIPIYALGFVTP